MTIFSDIDAETHRKVVTRIITDSKLALLKNTPDIKFSKDDVIEILDIVCKQIVDQIE